MACLLFAFGVWVPDGIIVPYIVIAASTFTIAQVFYIPASRALAAEMATTESRGRYVATYELSWGLAAAIGPALFGLTYDFTPTAPWFIMSVLVIGAMLLLRLAESGIPISRNRPEEGAHDWR